MVFGSQVEYVPPMVVSNHSVVTSKMGEAVKTGDGVVVSGWMVALDVALDVATGRSGRAGCAVKVSREGRAGHKGPTGLGRGEKSEGYGRRENHAGRSGKV
jgi:hypothetical protein